jgi:solute carrier family 23 (nucleobase transporter), member 1
LFFSFPFPFFKSKAREEEEEKAHLSSLSLPPLSPLPKQTAPAMGATKQDTARLVSTIFLASGLITLLQTYFGDRLPIIQGGSFAYIAPVLAIARDVQARPGSSWKTQPFEGEIIRDHARFLATIREVSGAVIASSLLIFLIAFTGLLGLILPFISPITVASNIAVVGLALYSSGIPAASSCWPLSMSSLCLLIFFSQYLRKVSLPKIGRVFETIPVVLTLAVVWPAAAIATAAGAWGPAGAVRENDLASLNPATLNCRVDVAEDGLLKSTPLFAAPPYPMQFGLPIFTASGTIVMLGGALAAFVESLGDYYAAARISGAPVPPPAAVSRAVLFQGIGCAVAGLFGTGSGTTAYNENLAAMAITRVASRRVARAAGLWLLVLGGLSPKFGALLASIPPPLFAGLFCVLFGLIAATGISVFQHADMSSSRNLLILGVSIYLGLSTPAYAEDKKFASNGGPVSTSSAAVNSAINGILKSGATVALIVSLFLDTTIPTTHAEERGLGAWHASRDLMSKWWEDEKVAAVYALPWGLSQKFGELRLRVRGEVGRFGSRALERVRGGCGGGGREKKKKKEEEAEVEATVAAAATRREGGGSAV